MRVRRRAAGWAFLVALLLRTTTAGAEEQQRPASAPAAEAGKPPGWLMAVVNTIVRPLPRGLLVLFPLVDNDPNRGLTIGVMPVLIYEDHPNGRIVIIHAPSAAYNRTFGVTGTYRLFAYPTINSEIRGRLSYSQHTNRDVVFQYNDRRLMESYFTLFVRTEWLRDGSARFYGIGPDTKKSDQSNYTWDHVYDTLRFGIPLADEGRLRLYVDQGLRFDRTLPGIVSGVPDLSDVYPQFVQADFRALLDAGLALGYDSRDSYVAPTHGVLLEVGGQYYPSLFGIDADFWNAGAEARALIRPSPKSRWIFAGQLHFNQMWGNAIPFYAQSQLGGKFSLRAFGASRFTDRGAAWANFEVRHMLWSTVVHNTPVEAWLDPFVGAGTVFHSPRDIELEDTQWVVGAAFRAIARPQVVGSIDVGYGPEGLAVFLDIDYSF